METGGIEKGDTWKSKGQQANRLWSVKPAKQIQRLSHSHDQPTPFAGFPDVPRFPGLVTLAQRHARRAAHARGW